ncbi:Flagellar L-ring protein precursor [Phycisphaerae bacterium RAS1]|nr:Flagellar L-ring protein precursor [Phycisphaerae bacterium RAS1]
MKSRCQAMARCEAISAGGTGVSPVRAGRGDRRDAGPTHNSLSLRLTAAFVLLGAVTASAQSNSLFRSGRAPSMPPAASQPARSSGGGLNKNAAMPGLRAAPPPRVDPEAQSTNPALLAFSPIAVEPPKPQVIQVNDLITIIIRETKLAISDSNLRQNKQWQVGSELGKWFRLNPEDHLIPQDFPNGAPGVEFKLQDQYQGRGRVDRRDELTTRITAKVIDVKPNGNLVLEAKKTIKQDEDEQVYTLTGVCRTDDLTPQNTVLSTQVAELIVDVQHAGAARDAARRGWLKRLTDFLRLE